MIDGRPAGLSTYKGLEARVPTFSERPILLEATFEWASPARERLTDRSHGISGDSNLKCIGESGPNQARIGLVSALSVIMYLRLAACRMYSVSQCGSAI